MSLHNQLEQYPRLLQAFPTATGLPENEEGVVRLGETLTPVIDIWNGRREWALLRGEQWYSRRINIAAGGAGTNAAVGLANPAGSGIVVVLVAATAMPSAAAQQVTMMAYADSVALAQWGLTAAGVPMDRRRVAGAGVTPLAASQAIVRSGNTPVGIPAGGQELETLQRSAVEPYDYRHCPQMLYAGDAVMLVQTVVVQGVYANLMWYERKCVTNEARG